MAVGDVYQLAVQGKCQGQDVVNIYHYETTSAGAGGNEETVLGAAFDALVAGAWQDAVHEDVNMTLITVTRVAPLPVGANYFTPIGWAGNRTGICLPSEVAAVVSKMGPVPGRHGRGRNYISGLLADDVIQTSGLWHPSAITLLSDFGSFITGPIVAATGEAFRPGLIPAPGGVFSPTDRYRINNAPRAQRRRQPGRGH